MSLGLELLARDRAGHLPLGARDDVVTGLPDDGVVVRQDAQMVRRLTAHDVEVVDVGGVAGRLDGGHVLVGVLRLGEAPLRRAEPGHVLHGEHEHVAADVLVHGVGEALARGLCAAVAADEADLDGVTGVRCDRRAVLGVPHVVRVPVTLPALPLDGPRRAGPAAVDRVLGADVAQRPLADDRDLLLGAVRHRERVGDQVRRVDAQDRVGVIGVVGRLSERERERDVLLELLLDEVLVVREDKLARAVLRQPLVVGVDRGRDLAGGHLRREPEGAVLHLHVRIGVAVGGVELGGDVRVVARDGRVVVVAGERPIDDIVGRRGGHLVPDAVEQQLGRGVVVDEEVEVDAGEQCVERLRLRLAVGRRPAVGVAHRVGRGALVVVAPVGGEVAVEVDAVAERDLAVAVVVAQVLAPQPIPLGEGEVVPVDVLHREEPQLAGVDEVGDLLVGPVAVQHVMHEPAHHLGRDPLTRVLGAHVHDRGTAPVADPVGVPRHT